MSTMEVIVEDLYEDHAQSRMRRHCRDGDKDRRHRRHHHCRRHRHRESGNGDEKPNDGAATLASNKDVWRKESNMVNNVMNKAKNIEMRKQESAYEDDSANWLVAVRGQTAKPPINAPQINGKKASAGPEEVLADLDSLEGVLPPPNRNGASAIPPPPLTSKSMLNTNEETGARAKTSSTSATTNAKNVASKEKHEKRTAKPTKEEKKEEEEENAEYEDTENLKKALDTKKNKKEESKEVNDKEVNDKEIENKDNNKNKKRRMSVMEACNPFVGTLWRRREAYSELWVSLSSMYGKLMVVVMLVLCVSEVMSDHIRPLTIQSFFTMYMLVLSIVVMTCLYVTVLLDNCPSSSSAFDAETGSLHSLATLRRSHIDKRRVSRTSFYLRIGALLFGLGTLVFNGLEIALHATMEESCVDNVLVAFPVLQAIFTFLQMHFLFVNSQVLVERFSLAARFGFMHLVATNLGLWMKNVIWESANEYVHHLQRLNNTNFDFDQGVNTLPIALSLRTDTEGEAQSDFLGPYRRDFMNDNRRSLEATFEQTSNTDALLIKENVNVKCSNASLVSTSHVDFVLDLYKCYNSNSLGQLWTTSMPYLFPFLVQYRLKAEVHFSLIAAAVTLVMWRQVGSSVTSGNDRANYSSKGKHLAKVENDARVGSVYWRVNCDNASKGLFMGLLCLVGGVIVLVLFFVMKEQSLPSSIFYLYSSTQMSVLSAAILAAVLALIQVQKVSKQPNREPMPLDKLINEYTMLGPMLHSSFSIVAALTNLLTMHSGSENLAVAILHSLLLTHLITQNAVLSEASRRACSTRLQQVSKPGRQVITFLLFVNATLLVIDTLISEHTQNVQMDFFGTFMWAIVQRVAMPLLTLHRFHVCVLLVEIWKNTYRTREAF